MLPPDAVWIDLRRQAEETIQSGRRGQSRSRVVEHPHGVVHRSGRPVQGDLDVDVVVNRDFSFKILDQEEFDANALNYRYPAELQARSRRALSELVKLIRIRAFPFTE